MLDDITVFGNKSSIVERKGSNQYAGNEGQHNARMFDQYRQKKKSYSSYSTFWSQRSGKKQYPSSLR